MSAETNSLLSFKTVQTIYLVRHGAAEHNIPVIINGVQTHPNLTDPKYTDSKLVNYGQNQAQNAGRMLQHALSINGEQIQGVLCSPLTRCLETMGRIVDVVGYRGQWTAREDLREAFGIHYSDRRSQRSQLEEQWRHVNFNDMTEQDEAWRSDKRESLSEVQHRIDRFLVWLSWNQVHHYVKSGDTNNNIQQGPYLIVSHGVWIESMLEKYCPSLLEGNKRVYNCDIYRVTLIGQWGRDSVNSKWECAEIYLETPVLVHSNHYPSQMNPKGP